MQNENILSYQLGRNYCKLFRDIKTNDIIVKGFRKRRKSNLEEQYLFPDTPEGHKRSLEYFKAVFIQIFENERPEFKKHCDKFLSGVNDDILNLF